MRVQICSAGKTEGEYLADIVTHFKNLVIISENINASAFADQGKM